ncbi:hypothetical protein FORC087_194 (plasmid) [Bacillus cereus]|nr:hypothetical protein FORC087_194 [Bacillus cereus]
MHFLIQKFFIKNLLSALPHMNLRQLKGKGQKSPRSDCTGKYYNVIEK